MSLKLILDKEPNEDLDEDSNRYLTITQETNLIELMYRSEYQSFFPLAYIDKT